MKKTLILALAGLMILAFAQCSGGGSKEYQDAQKVLNKVEKAVKNAKTCDDLDKASELIWTESPKVEYEEKEKLTDDERQKLADLLTKIDEVYKSQSEKFGCD